MKAKKAPTFANIPIRVSGTTGTGGDEGVDPPLPPPAANGENEVLHTQRRFSESQQKAQRKANCEFDLPARSLLHKVGLQSRCRQRETANAKAVEAL